MVSDKPSAATANMISVRTMATPKPFTMCQGSPANRSSQSELFFSPPRLPSRSSCASVLNPMVASAQANSNAAAIAAHSENSPQTATGIAISAQGSMPRPNIAPRFTSAGLGASATFGPSIPDTGGNDIAGDCCAAATVACGMTDGGCRMAMRCNAGLMVGSTCVGASAGFHAFWAGSICVDGMDCGITCVPVGIARVPCDCGIVRVLSTLGSASESTLVSASSTGAITCVALASDWLVTCFPIT